MDEPFEQHMVGECLSGRVRALSRVVTSIFDRAYRPYEIRSSQVNILVVIAAYGPLTPTETCRKLCLEKSTLSRDLDRLIDRDMISVTKGTGRSLKLTISPGGRELIRQLEPAWAAAQAEVRRILGTALTDEILHLFEEGRLFSIADEAN